MEVWKVEVDVLGRIARRGVRGLGEDGRDGEEERDEDVLWAEDNPDDDRDWTMKLIMVTEEQEAQYLEDVFGIRKDKRGK